MSLFSSADSVDRAVFEANDIAGLFFVMVIGSIVMETAAVFYLFKPATIGFYLGLAAVLWSVLGNIVVTVLILIDPETSKAAYIASRVARGLSVRPELYDAMFTPVGMTGILAFAILLNALVAFLLVWNRRYFSTRPSTST